MTLLSIQLRDEAAALSAIEKLLTRFSGHERIARVVIDIANEYREPFKKHDKAIMLYQHVLANWPNATCAIWSQMGVVLCNIDLGDDAKAKAAIAKLLRDFAGRKGIAKAVVNIAREYRRLQRYEKSHEVYQSTIDVLNKRPESQDVIWSQAAAVVSNVALGNDTTAQPALDKLIADFNDDPDLPVALWRAADTYYNQAFLYRKEGLDAKAKEHFAKVISLGERIRQQSPASTTTAETYFFSAECYGRLGQYEKAIEYYRKVVDKWPEYEYAWLAQFRIVKMYKWLIRAGVMSQPEAEAAMAVAFERLIERFPRCPAARTARNWLERNARSNQGGQK